MGKNKKFSSFGRIITLVLILVIPGLLHYYLRQTGQNVYHELPYPGSPEPGSATRVAPFSLQNQDGRTVSFPGRKSVKVVHFMHTECDGFGGLMIDAMDAVAKKFGKHPFVDLYSISLDPDDDAGRLSVLAERFQVEENNWQFLGGAADSTSKIAREHFLVDGYVDKVSDKIIHTPYFILVDSNQQIRGYYEYHTKDEMERLIGEVILLVTEEYRRPENI